MRNWFSVLLIAGLLVQAACQDPERELPRIDSLEPNRVSSQDDTPATITGDFFYGEIQIDLGSNDPPVLDLAFQVIIGETRLAKSRITYQSPQQLDIVIPAGLPAGIHPLTVITPGGRSATLVDALEVDTCRDDSDCVDPCRSESACVDLLCSYAAVDKDTDGDGFIDAACPGGDDCDDDPAACGADCRPDHPDGDACDGLDQDCDGQTDEDGDPDCDDGLYCTGTDTCVQGACQSTGDPCVGGMECADSCDEENDSCLDPAGTACQDDGNLCTDDECNGLGVCTHPDNSAPCDDGLFCTAVDVCTDGACQGGGDRCPDQECNEAEDRCEGAEVFDDPLGDGSSFAFVVEYQNRIWLGPRSDGTGAVHMQPDGSQSGSSDFSFFADTTGNTHRNTSSAPYPSIGTTGCSADSAGCGPDNEDGRGIFCSGSFGGDQWLVVAGARQEGDLDYVYLTRDDGALLEFSYLDLSPLLGPQTRGISAMHVFAGRLYLGFPDTGGARPYLVSVIQPPQPPGLDVVGNGGGDCDPLSHDACNLYATDLPEIGGSAPMSMIDSITDFHDRLYLANNGGILRSTVEQPLDAGSSIDHWAAATPEAVEYTSLTSLTTDKTADIEPADKAVPAMAALGDTLFVARNTVSGPQLWACSPELDDNPPPATAGDCDPGDWRLVAPNTLGNPLLTQFNDPNNTHISMLEAGDNHLYLAFDNPVDGLLVFRTANPQASQAVHFEGIDGNGFGDPANTRVFSSELMSRPNWNYLYLVIGNGIDPVKLVRLVDSIRECEVDIACDDQDPCTADFCFNGTCATLTTCPGVCENDCTAGCQTGNCCVQECPQGDCPDCPPGCSCEFSCDGTSTCSTSCEDAVCHLESNSGDQAGLTCQDAACFLDCNSQGGCQMECLGESQCRVDCNSVDSCVLNCTAPSSCLLQCNSVGSCELVCEDLVDCGNGIFACRHGCP